MSDYYPGWLLSLRVITRRLNMGKYEEAAELLFDPKIQYENRHRHEFWYAQVLVAALLGRGFHIAFHTGKIAMLGRMDIIRMLAYFEKYANQPEYETHRDTIHYLIAFYQEWDKKNPPRPKTGKLSAPRTTQTIALPEKLFR